MSFGKLQMVLFSSIVAVGGIGSFVYVMVAKPPYLHASREGVPYFTPAVVNPQGGKPLDMNMLVRHYKGADK